ncbi:MAG: hypothetical protein FWC23_09740 [Chitinispirillia bacterium]|nr:hypothetical protein [Chitinispirillia bacterium]MCL2269451.1 hypothetical protein [Chitinispirillia bacterium]
MSSELLLMAVLAAMTCVAMMIAINSRGRWRATLSSLMAVCMLGGTIWVFTLQYNLSNAFEAPGEAQGERRRVAPEPDVREQPSSKHERAGQAATMNSMISEAARFAEALTKERMHDPLLSHAQLVARADATERRYENLKREVDGSGYLFERYPSASKLLSDAMGDLRAACHFYRAYYYAENTDAEISTERLLKQRAKNALDTLNKAAKAVKDSVEN